MNGLKETDAAYELPKSHEWPPRKLWSDRNMNQIVNQLEYFPQSLTLNAVFCVIVSSLHKTKIDLGGRLMTVHPTISLACFTRVACVAGQVGALGYDEEDASELVVR
jgi:hypothetical protein